MNGKKEPLLKSTRFWTLVAGLVSYVLVNELNMPEETADSISTAILVLVPTYILGRSIRNTATDQGEPPGGVG